jgi:hypothetical protein
LQGKLAAQHGPEMISADVFRSPSVFVINQSVGPVVVSARSGVQAATVVFNLDFVGVL